MSRDNCANHMKLANILITFGAECQVRSNEDKVCLTRHLRTALAANIHQMPWRKNSIYRAIFAPL